MTREQMLKYKFKPYQMVIFKNPRNGKESEYILLGVDFDCETFKLARLIPSESMDGKEDFYLPIELCTPSFKIHALKK